MLTKQKLLEQLERVETAGRQARKFPGSGFNNSSFKQYDLDYEIAVLDDMIKTKFDEMEQANVNKKENTVEEAVEEINKGNTSTIKYQE